MRKFHIVGVAFAAVFAFFAVSAVSAFAAPGEWLVEGNTFSGTLSAETVGLIELIKLKSTANAELLNAIDCEGILDGTITQAAGVKGTDEITAILNLLGELIEELPGLALSCTVSFSAGEIGDCLANTLAELWVHNLYNANGPWLTELLELEEPKVGEVLVLDELFGPLRLLEAEPGYEVRCEIATGVFGEILCLGSTEFNLRNDATTMPVSVLVGASEAETPEVECSTDGGTTWETGVGALEGSPNLWALEGATRLATAVS